MCFVPLHFNIYGGLRTGQGLEALGTHSLAEVPVRWIKDKRWGSSPTWNSLIQRSTIQRQHSAIAACVTVHRPRCLGSHNKSSLQTWWCCCWLTQPDNCPQIHQCFLLLCCSAARARGRSKDMLICLCSNTQGSEKNEEKTHIYIFHFIIDSISFDLLTPNQSRFTSVHWISLVHILYTHIWKNMSRLCVMRPFQCTIALEKC